MTKPTEQPARLLQKGKWITNPETGLKNSNDAGQPFEQPKCCQTNESGGILANPEQPNQDLMIVKTIQSLITMVNDNLGKLDELSMGSTKHKVLIRQALEEIDLFEKTTLYDLQKAFE